ncbi:MAG TPA: hypothetical protein VFY65_17765, partial [Longimicrobium sp.]|nr:hypothetical protein [Longimicrobium sp.]
MPSEPAVFFGVGINHKGVVDLGVVGPASATATYYERVGQRRVRIAGAALDGAGVSLLPRVSAWRCDRLIRRFEVEVSA